MARLNKPIVRPRLTTFEGSTAGRITDLQALYRAMASCMLWEKQFYEAGQAIAERIEQLVLSVHPEDAAACAVYTREAFKLRHAPLLIARVLARGDAAQRKVVGELLPLIIQRADELAEFLAIYWQNGRQPLSWQVKQGLRAAFNNFTEYQLAKWAKESATIRVKDVAFLVHPKPSITEIADRSVPALVKKNGYRRGMTFRHSDSLITRLIEDRLEEPDTWERQLSAGKDKAETFTRLIEEKNLGGLALLRNLRNMIGAKVDDEVIRLALHEMNTERILPFRFITAAQFAPSMEPDLEAAMFRCLAGLPQLEGRTALIVDTSPSMWQAKVSANSEMTRFDAAAALAILCRQVCEDVRVYWFNENAGEVPSRRGFALRDALHATQGNYSYGGKAMRLAAEHGYDRLIVLTDGQWHQEGSNYLSPGETTHTPLPSTKAYMVNLAANRNAVGGRGTWTLLEGFSEAILDFIVQDEALSTE